MGSFRLRRAWLISHVSGRFPVVGGRLLKDFGLQRAPLSNPLGTDSAQAEASGGTHRGDPSLPAWVRKVTRDRGVCVLCWCLHVHWYVLAALELLVGLCEADRKSSRRTAGMRCVWDELNSRVVRVSRRYLPARCRQKLIGQQRGSRRESRWQSQDRCHHRRERARERAAHGQR